MQGDLGVLPKGRSDVLIYSVHSQRPGSPFIV